VLLGDDVVESAGVEGENWFDRAAVLHARDGVGFVMIHVAGGDDQNRIVLHGNHIRNGVSELLKSVELSGAQRNRNKPELGLAGLQKG
jgi:hypothetical protein